MKINGRRIEAGEVEHIILNEKVTNLFSTAAAFTYTQKCMKNDLERTQLATLIVPLPHLWKSWYIKSRVY